MSSKGKRETPNTVCQAASAYSKRVGTKRRPSATGGTSKRMYTAPRI